MPHRRATRCSRMPAIASFSSTSRSHCPPFSAIRCFLQHYEAVTILDGEFDQGSAGTGAAKAFSAGGGVRRSVSRAYQIAFFKIEKRAGLPIELHGHVRAPVEVRMGAAFEPHDKSG